MGDRHGRPRRAGYNRDCGIELLGERGLQLAWAEYVGDDPARITDVLRRAFASGDVVMSCGGIGATPDDHTRQCAAAGMPVIATCRDPDRADALQALASGTGSVTVLPLDVGSAPSVAAVFLLVAH